MGKKTFYTERDIEDLARRGVTSLTLDDEVVLTDLAREKAERLGVKLFREHDAPPSAPVRPYIAASPQGRPPARAEERQDKEAMAARVRAAVIRRLGEDYDPNLLDAIIRRVIDSLGVK